MYSDIQKEVFRAQLWYKRMVASELQEAWVSAKLDELTTSTDDETIILAFEDMLYSLQFRRYEYPEARVQFAKNIDHFGDLVRKWYEDKAEAEWYYAHEPGYWELIEAEERAFTRE